jgi:phosphoadenosine phosphosulfate reductase
MARKPRIPLDFPVATRVASLNDRYRLHGATAVLERALSDPEVGRIALVSSFGAESVVLLHMVSVMDRKTPVLFLNTEMLFPETLQYQRELAERLELEDIRVITPDAGMVAALEFFENEGDVRIKVNPLAMWAKEDVQEYMLNNRLPRHPLVKQGYPSIGCAPCTTKVAPGEDERAGRWRGLDKDECGIHFVNGRVVRGPLAKEDGPMNVIVTDKGFAADDFTWPVTKLADLPADDPEALAVEVGPADDVTALSNRLAKIDLIRVTFPSFSDGRGFTHARRLRLMGYTGRLRAAGHVIADQYAMARRSGFDEVEISPDLAARQPQEQWLRRADWTAHDYQARLRA